MATKSETGRTKKRLKKRETPLDVWIAHRKARKKLASAKWYAKKKKREIQDQNSKRQKLETEWQQRQQQPVWTPTQFCEWRCALEHHNRGWPVRPVDIPAEDWCKLLDLGYESLARVPDANVAEDFVLKQLCIRELLGHYRSHGLSPTMDRVHRTSEMARTTCNSSVWERAASALASGWFPMVCTHLGVLFLQLAALHQTHRWPDVCRYITQRRWTENNNRNNTVHITADQPPQANPPSQNPNRNDNDDDEEWDDVIQHIIDQHQWLDVSSSSPTNSSTTSSCSSVQSSLDLSSDSCSQ